MTHPQHDAVAAALRGVYRRSHPEMGWVVEERRHGVYRRNVKAATYPVVVVGDLSTADVAGFLADVRDYFGAGAHPARIMIEDRDRERTLGPALEAAGLTLDERTTFVAHVGDVPELSQVQGLTIEEVGEHGLTEYEDTRRRGFADSDEPSPPDALATRAELGRAEMEGGARYWLARVEDEPAAAMSWYDIEDRLIFSLATRVVFRKRGIASHLICRLVEESQDAGVRSVLINADEADRPIRLYRRLGFTDEVYWRATYELDLSS